MAKLVICKTCGNDDLTEISEGVLKCRYCRHLTEKPKENSDLMERAHNLRFNTKDFDESAKLYEEVIRLTPDEAEAYWGKALCRFGIEYVKDANGEYLPTCHRTIQSSILEDSDYLMAVSKASGEMKDYYTEQAKLIDSYQTKIKVIAAKEEPYDVFISFKANDGGVPTEDSLIAQDIYYYLTKNLGLKVFFSNITLKDKAGQEYEPIIYAALNSATVMVLVGTKPEYVNATWVKNEWSRYVAMMAEAKRNNKSKYIVSALKGMLPEELPSALAAYQAVNIGELGAKEKLCSNIDGLIGDLRVKQNSKSSGAVDPNEVLAAQASNLCNLGFQNITLGDTVKAGEYFQKALELKSDTSLAFWGKLLISEDVESDDELSEKLIPLKEYALYRLAMENATAEEKMRYETVANKCEENVRRADSKTRHTTEYRSEIEKVKYNYANNYNGSSKTSINEEADGLFSALHDAKYRFSQASSQGAKCRAKKSSAAMWIIIGLLLAALILLPGIAGENFATKTDDWFAKNTNVDFIEAYEEADLNLFDVLNSYDELQKMGITEVVQERFVETLTFDNYMAEILMAGIPLIIFCFIIVFWIIKKIIGSFFGFILTLGLAPAGAVCLMVLVLMASIPSGINWIILVGGALIGLCLLMMILGIFKNMRLKGKIKEWDEKYKTASADIDDAYGKLITYSGAHVDEINDRYYSRYGDEIDDYEPNYCIAVESFNASDKDIATYLGVENVIRSDSTGSASGGSVPDDGVVDVYLINPGKYQALVRKEIMEILGASLDQARYFTDNYPICIAEGINAATAKKLVGKLESHYAEAEIR